MTITTQTILDQREIRPNGTILLRFAKVVMNDGAAISSGWHRASLPPGTVLENALPQISTGLVALGFPPISDEDTGKITDLAAHVWTPEVIAAYQEAE